MGREAERPRRLVVEADGGSRGNPGPAAYGAVVRDATSGAILGEGADTIGTATNNVSEYHGLIAGLQLAREVDPDAAVDVRMDSRLVIEQMAGRWKVTHDDMRRLATRARQLTPPGTTWTWVPREHNKVADALVNKVLDGGARVWSVGTSPLPEQPLAEPTDHPVGQRPTVPETGPTRVREDSASRPVGWGAPQGMPSTLLLLRHGETVQSVAKRFSGSGGEDVGLTDRGRAQAEAAAAALAGRGGIDAIVASPLLRTRQTARIVGAALGLPVTVEPGFAETAFGEWDGLTFAEAQERWPAELDAWLASTAVAPPGGESFDTVAERVQEAHGQLLRSYPGQTVVVVTHVTPIKLMVCFALDVPPRTMYRMELPPGSLSEALWFPDGLASLRSFGVTHLTG